MRRRATSVVRPWPRDVAPGPGVAWLHAFNARDLAGWSRRLCRDVVVSYPGLRGPRGAEAAHAYNVGLLVAFSDLQFHARTSTGDGARVTTTWRLTGTHDGDLVTEAGVITPTARAIDIEGATLVTVRGELVAREEAYWDRLELFAQLGV